MQPAGFVLVGGFSTRMGQDKALLPSGQLPLVQHIAQQVASATASVALVGKPERYQHLGLDCITDLRPDLGPLAGIEAALGSQRGDLNLIVACDMPGLTSKFLRALLHHAEQTEALCVVTRDRSGAIHPLCAAYRSSCLPVIERALNARHLRLMDVIEELDAIHFTIADVLWNVNTPQEWSDWRQQYVSPEGAPFALTNGK